MGSYPEECQIGLRATLAFSGSSTENVESSQHETASEQRLRCADLVTHKTPAAVDYA